MYLPLLLIALGSEPGPFPLPAIDGKPLVPSGPSTRFRVPNRFDKVRAFYEHQLAREKGVTLSFSRVEGLRKLTLVSKRSGDAWAKAIVTEAPTETIIDIMPAIRGEQLTIEGTLQRPLVQFVFGRDPAAAGAAAAIDHSEVLLKR